MLPRVNPQAWLYSIGFAGMGRPDARREEGASGVGTATARPTAVREQPANSPRTITRTVARTVTQTTCGTHIVATETNPTIQRNQ